MQEHAEKKAQWRVKGCLDYEDSEKLIERLESEGIVASLVAGGIGVHPTENQERRTLEICNEFNVTAGDGVTIHEELWVPLAPTTEQ